MLTRRAVWALACVGALDLVLVPWGASRLGVWLVPFWGLALIVDGMLVWRRDRPRVGLDAERQVFLGHDFVIELTSDGPVRVALALSPAVGGPFVPQEVFGTTSVSLHPRKRGRHPIGPLWAFDASPLGFWERKTVLETGAEIEVWPDILDAQTSLGALERGRGVRPHVSRTFDSLELRSLRPFALGDDPRHVDWKTSARLRMPIVREWQLEARRTVFLVLDAGRLMCGRSESEDKFDAALRTTCRVAWAAGDRGDRVGALAFHREVLRVVPPLDGKKKLTELVRRLNDLNSSLVASDLSCAVPYLASVSHSAMLLVLTDVMNLDDSERLAAALRPLSETHRTTVLCLKEPALAAYAALDGDENRFRRDAARAVDDERNEAIDWLRGVGARVIDTGVREISLDAVDAYSRWAYRRR